MTFEDSRARHFGVACFFLLIAACGSNPPGNVVVETADASNHFVGTQPIYAELIRERGGSWVFTRVSDSDMPSGSGYLVRLNDLTPAFDVRAAECFPQVYPEHHRCSPLHPFREKDTGMLDKIINGSIAVGTAGKVTDLSQTYETTFDEAAFNGAVDEALLNTGLDENRRTLISSIDAYGTEMAQAEAELAELQMRLAQSDGKRLELDIRPQIGGLTQYYGKDIDYTDIVTLVAADNGAAAETRLERHEILPCDTRQCVAKANAALSSLRQDVQRQKQLLSESMQPELAVYNVRCDASAARGYTVSVACPEQIFATGGERATLDIGVTILARDFDSLLPNTDIGDEQIEVSIDGDIATFTNVSNEYITVTAQTVYYNSQTHTTSERIDVPPGISINKQLRDFLSPAIEIESSYKGMTPDKAAGASFRFGFAVRYRTASQVEERTLHTMENYNVGCVIENRIRPGSCRAEQVADIDYEDEAVRDRYRAPH
jgi:hypothetical protein